MSEIPYGYCHCGCGQKTSIAKQSSTKTGAVNGQPMRYISGHNNGKGEKALGWKGGRNKTSHGYVVVHAPEHPRAFKTGYVYEHILVAEQTTGAPLPPKAVVHHLNHNKKDNRPENLLVCKDQAEHFLVHQRERALAECGNPDLRQCTFCRQWDKPENLNRLNNSPYHKECARIESKRRYDAGLCKRDRAKVNEYWRNKNAAEKEARENGMVKVQSA